MPTPSDTPGTPGAPDRGDARQVGAMFGRIARRYDALNHVLSGGLDIVWRRALVRSVGAAPVGRALDLAAGTMDVSLALARRNPGMRMVCLDVCRPMLERGMRKAGEKDGAGARFLPVVGDALALPLESASVDLVTVAFGVRNMSPRAAVFDGVFRVLRPGGRFAMLEFGSAGRPVWMGIYNFYLLYVLPRLGKLLGSDGAAYAYLAETIRTFPDADALDRELEGAGFCGVRHAALSGGIVYLHVAQKGQA